MPYVRQEDRPALDIVVDRMHDVIQTLHSGDVVTLNPGDINYVFSRLIWRLFNEYPSYLRSCILRGILADVRHEFTRRLVDRREDEKIEENGDLPEGKNLKSET